MKNTLLLNKIYLTITFISCLVFIGKAFGVSNLFNERPEGERYGLEFEVTPPEFVGMIHLFDVNTFCKKIIDEHISLLKKWQI